MILTDRTRHQTGLDCLRKRFWGWHFGGQGIEPLRRSVPLATGGAVHEGLAHLLRSHLGNFPASPEAREFAIEVASGFHIYQVNGRQLDLESNEDAQFVATEQRMLTRALVDCWARVGLPALLAEYEVVDVEREERWEPVPGITFMARADAILRQRATGDYYIKSFKTAAGWDLRQDAVDRHDVQGISEGMVVEARLRSAWEQGYAVRDMVGLDDRTAEPPKVMGVSMDYLLKGRREEFPKGSGRIISTSPLIWGLRLINPAGEQRFGWKREWLDPEGRSRRLDYRTWERFAVWGDSSLGDSPESRVANWIAMLAAGEVQPEAGPCLESQVVTPETYFRTPEESEEWREQMVLEEERISYLSHIGDTICGAPNMPGSGYWPMNRRRCHDYNRPCEFTSLCYGAAGRRADPLTTGDFKWREANHPEKE